MNFVAKISPGENRAFNVKGDFLAVVVSNSDLMIRIPGEEENLFQQGHSLEMPAGEKFERLEVRNPSASVTCDVIIYAGFGRFRKV